MAKWRESLEESRQEYEDNNLSYRAVSPDLTTSWCICVLHIFFEEQRKAEFCAQRSSRIVLESACAFLKRTEAQPPCTKGSILPSGCTSARYEKAKNSHVSAPAADLQEDCTCTQTCTIMCGEREKGIFYRCEVSYERAD